MCAFTQRAREAGMAQSDFGRALAGAERRMERAAVELARTRRLLEREDMAGAFGSAFAFSAEVEKLALLARVLPAYTGHPKAAELTEQMLLDTVPIEMGYARRGWFLLKIPALLPKKGTGSPIYIQQYLYPALRRYRGQPKGDVLHYLLNKRLGAEVDYIVKGIDQEHNVVAASRLEAMALKRREYYFRTDRDGNYQIYEGIRAEARVISVIRAGIFVDLFGAECYIPLRELSYQRWVDAAQHYQPGQRVLVRVLEVDRSDRSRPRVTASVKQAMENPYEKALKKYVVGNRYVGTVSMVDLNGVFVSLDGGIDCLCTYPKRGRPPRGARATVRILGINHENNRIWGVITHMSTTR